MPKKTRECVICKKVEAISKKSYIIINSAESENKLRMGYWNRFGTDISAESLINSHAHKACYIKITRKLPPIKIQQQRVLKHSPLAKNGQNDVSLSKPVENPNAEEDTLEKEVTEINQSSTVLNNCDENVPDICSNEFSEIMYGSTTNGSSIAMCRKKVKGEIVAMSDIKITYENILSRRKEPYSPAILLGNAIRARLELKFGDYIFFYRRSNITSSFVRGEEAMRSYIVDRLINKTIKIDEPLTTMTFLKLSDADHYVPGERPNTKKKNLLNTHSRDLSKNLNSIDRLMRDAVIVAEQRNITLSSVFSHEFTIAPLSLCDLRDNNIMYQQNKSSIIDYIKSQFSTSFSSSPPSIHETQALIIDGRSILQIKPVGKRVTVRQYANQLLKMIIVYNFNSFNRIDVVFDSPSYDLKCDDVFDSDYHQLVMNNEAIIASRIRECWSASTSIQALPDGKVLVIAGPDESSVTLKKYCDPINDYLLVSNHAEAATRLFIHAQAISYENIKSIVCQSYDTDVIILGIAHALSLDVNNFFIKSFNTKGKFYTYINIREIALAIKKKFLIDPIILLVIHALSVDGISCAERLLLDCYSYTNTASSLDDLRATVASSSFKQNRASFVAPTLPPTSDAFYFHCQRAARQIQIWSQVYQSDMTIQTVENSEGYEIRQNDVQLKWLSLSCFPTDDRLSNSISTSRPLSQPVTSTPQKLKFTTITSRRAMTQENATTYEDISIVSFSPFQDEKMTIGNYLLRRLKSLDVDIIFGVPGDYNLPFLDQIEDFDGIQWGNNCNELNASYAADGYARIRGIGVLVTTFGVGELSAINGIAGSFAEMVPVVHIVGMPPTVSQSNGAILHHTLGNGDFRVFANMFKEVTIAQTILTKNNAIEEIDRVLTQCLLKDRPVYIGLAIDLSDFEVNVESSNLKPLELKIPHNPKETHAAAIEAVINAAKRAQNIVVIVDACAIRHDLMKTVLKFIEHTQLPIYVTPMAKGGIDENHPQFRGVFAGNCSLEQVQKEVYAANLVLSIGSMNSDFNTGGFTYRLLPKKTIGK
ncbi:unnamed protein product [Rotaria sp. Silwood1]|nr:unnamed protein product [Rotaria sp. Silwood1]